MRIGFFDSGLGGLTIMRAVETYLPQYQYLYFGDTKNLPYGDKTEKEIYELTKRGVESLFSKDALLVIVACNTASAETLRRLQNTFLFNKYPERKILGVIIPTVEEVIERRKNSVLLIGTRRTVESNKYEKELSKQTLHNIALPSIATPELVPLIEENKIDEAMELLTPIIERHIADGGDGLILGCTHYTVLKEHIRSEYPNLELFTQDEIIPDKLKKYLLMHPEIESLLNKQL
jgi:glutamate racemase